MEFVRRLILFVGLVFALMNSHEANAQRYTMEEIGLEEGMPSSRVNDIIEDSRGIFWIGTEGAGLLSFDGFDFKKLNPGFDDLQPIVSALAEDEHGMIWFAMENALIRYDGSRFSRFLLPGDPQRIIDVEVDDANRVFVATRKDVFLLNENADLSKFFDPGGSIQDIIWHNDQLWLASNTALYRGEELVESGFWNSLTVFKGELIAQSAKGIWSENGSDFSQLTGRFVHARDDQILSLGYNDLQLMSPEGTYYFSQSNGLPEQDYKGCYIDRSAVVWLFSNSGLLKIPGTSYQLYDELGEVFSVSKVDDELLAGTSRGIGRISVANADLNLSEDFPYGVVLAVAYHKGYYWLGTESGLIRYDGRQFVQIDLMKGSSGDFVFALHSDGTSLWVGAGTGVYAYRNSRVKRIILSDGDVAPSVYAISEGRDGSLWFASYTQGLFRFFDGQWENIRSLGGLALDSLRFSCFSAESRNELFLGTLSEGVFFVNESSTSLISADELDYAEVRAMSRVLGSKLWLSTNKGVYKLEKQNEDFSIEHLRPSQTMMDEGGISQAIFADDEEILVGTETGLLRIDLSELNVPRAKPALVISAVELFYGQIEGLDENSSGSEPFTDLPLDLNLPHDLNFISFRLAGLSGYEPKNLIYRYRIEKGEEWTLAGGRREAVFPNLSPGNYTFQAQVSRPGEDWGSEILEYRFSIRPPVWQQWWFILSFVLLLGGLTYWYVRERIKRINQRLRLENSLMDMERKALRLQMNPHFIFNALDSISSFIFKNDVEQAVRYLNNFAKLMRLTLESSMEHLHPVESEVSILKNYLELEKLRFQGKLEYEFDVSEDIDFDVGIPPMLIQPHVENAILHGIKPKEGPGKVSIRFFLKDDQLICEIEDDGIGRKKSGDLQKRADHRSMATQINRDRLELLKKSLGGSVNIKIIDKEKGTGTLVRISLPAEQF